ncbi:Tn7 transposase TnsA N-terminal domain-containing protein [Acinetobacter baylyi]|uniref:Tn7 transposase TnsA N-terminal domain-containing protein n=1 Tax=Acinetobacter baylyi TaxID=202950 RepID=UPI001D195D1A|nr:Tn7 transposase TnsA N-terminal domain-containing protein [Acinetobacter baylyi]
MLLKGLSHPKNVRTAMHLSYTENKTAQLNQNLLRKFEEAFQKQTHVSSKHIGERRIKSRIGSRVSLFPSAKNEGLICLESNLELAHAISLERNEDILQYRTQAVQIFISDQHFIIPDFIVKTSNGFEVHEIKPNLESLSENKISRFKLVEKILKNYNIKFRAFDRSTLLSKEDYIFLNISYQRANHKEIIKIELKRAESIIKNKIFNSRDELYTLMKSNNLEKSIADYFIFYKKALGF